MTGRIKNKILLIDDEPDVLEFLSYNFSKKNFEVHVAPDGIKGIEEAELFLPDIIISDILMPSLSGIEMCKKLRQKEAFGHIPFIFLTAVHDDFQVMHAMLSGGDQYLNKPVRFEYLLAIVNDLLSEKVA